MKNDIEYKDSYVAFLDILGFKNMVERNNRNILNILTTFKQDKKDFFLAFGRANDPDNPESDIEKYNNALKSISYYMMSDSIVVSAPSSEPYALEVVIRACMMIQIELYRFDEPVLLRGAISKGDYYQKGSIAFGPALVEAYSCQEIICKYPRIIVSGKLINSSYDIKAATKMLYKDEEDYYFYIDCLKEYLSGSKKGNPRIDKFKKFIEEHLNMYEPASIREKYIWLSKDYNRVISDKNLRINFC